MRSYTIVDGVTTEVESDDLMMRRLTKSVQEVCKHPEQRVIDSRSGYPADTSIFVNYCPDCRLEWTEELTLREMDEEREAWEREQKAKHVNIHTEEPRP